MSSKSTYSTRFVAIKVKLYLSVPWPLSSVIGHRLGCGWRYLLLSLTQHTGTILWSALFKGLWNRDYIAQTDLLSSTLRRGIATFKRCEQLNPSSAGIGGKAPPAEWT